MAGVGGFLVSCKQLTRRLSITQLNVSQHKPHLLSRLTVDSLGKDGRSFDCEASANL
jgi:hypothetical protein